MAVRDRDLRIIRRGCTNKQVKALLVAVLKNGARYRMTKSGIIIYGEHGQTVGSHFTSSNGRGYYNLLADFRRAGLLKGTPWEQ